jgi:hypothetical protein
MAAYPASDAMTDARCGAANSHPDVQQHASPSCPRRSFSYPHDTTYGRATTDTSDAPVGGMAPHCGGAVLERRFSPVGAKRPTGFSRCALRVIRRRRRLRGPGVRDSAGDIDYDVHRRIAGADDCQDRGREHVRHSHRDSHVLGRNDGRRHRDRAIPVPPRRIVRAAPQGHVPLLGRGQEQHA